MNSAHPDLKQKAKHELLEMLQLAAYLAFFFCALAVYDMLLLNQYDVVNWNFGFALINALVITKVIMLGEYAKIGRKYERGPLLLSAVWKAFIFGLLVYAFHIIEEAIKRLIHGAPLITTPREMRFDQLAARAVIVFCIFVPLFAFRELRRVMGEDQFRALLFGPEGTGKMKHLTGN